MGLPCQVKRLNKLVNQLEAEELRHSFSEGYSSKSVAFSNQVSAHDRMKLAFNAGSNISHGLHGLGQSFRWYHSHLTPHNTTHITPHNPHSFTLLYHHITTRQRGGNAGSDSEGSGRPMARGSGRGAMPRASDMRKIK